MHWLLALLGCAEPAPTDTGYAPAPDVDVAVPDGELSGVEATRSGVVPTVVRLRWTSPVPGEGFVEYSLDGALDQATPVQSEGTTHEAVVLGLRAGETYLLRAVTRTADGDRYESGVGIVQLELPPASLGSFDVVVDAPGRREGGYVLTSLLQASESWVVILDRQGELVWYFPATDGYSIPTTTPGRDGASVLLTQNSIDQAQDISNIQRVRLDGTAVTKTRASMGHHAFVELPDQRFAWLGLELRVAAVDGELLSVAGDSVLEIAEGATEADAPTTLFSYFDDYGPPERMCEHFDQEAFLTGARDWTHANSLVHVEEQDALYLMSKHYDHVLRLDRDGALVEELGGARSDYEGREGAWWSHGHMSHAWPGGMVVFDNGYHHASKTSRVMAYTWDEGSGRISSTFEYVDPDAQFIQLLGDGRLLDNGNLLTAWTSLGVIKEHQPDGTVVWQAETSLGTAVGRVTMIDDLYTLARGEAW